MYSSGHWLERKHCTWCRHFTLVCLALPSNFQVLSFHSSHYLIGNNLGLYKGNCVVYGCHKERQERHHGRWKVLKSMKVQVVNQGLLKGKVLILFPSKSGGTISQLPLESKEES